MIFRSLLLTTCLGLIATTVGVAPQAWSADEVMPLAKHYDPSQPRSKISSHLLAYIDQPVLSPQMQARLETTSVHASVPGKVVVRIDVEVTDANLAAIRATGVTIKHVTGRWKSVSVEATLQQLDALALLPAVNRIVLSTRPMHGTDQGDGVMQTDVLRTSFNITGSGRTVGIISDTINDTSTVTTGTVVGTAPNAVLSATLPQVGGALPPTIQVIDFGDPAQASTGTDEGEAMCEEIFAIAPGADIAFAAADDDDSIMADNISLLKSVAGCSIIADDVVFLDEPFFQDGPIAQAIDTFAQAGGMYFSAAENNGNAGLMQNYTAVGGAPDPHTGPGGAPSTGSGFQNWGTGSATPGFLPVTMQAGVTINFVLNWNQPYSSYGLGHGSQSDFDLYVYDSPSINGTILASSNNAQGRVGAPSGDPNEIAAYSNGSSSAQTVYVAVDHYAGLNSGVLRMIAFGDGAFLPPVGDPVFNGPVSFGHCTAAGALAVAAVDYHTPTTVDDYSSKGGWGATGIPFYFDNFGNALSSVQLRNKPDLTAPDDITCYNANFNPFQGTSCATPNAAACAELVWEVQPTSNAAQIVARLESTASAVASPDAPGPDDYTGYGLVNAVLAATGTDITSVISTTAAGTYLVGTVPILVRFSSAVTVAGGTPTFTLNTNPPEVATYASGSGTSTLTFNYTIASGDHSAALDVASVGAFNLNGATVRDASSNLVTTAFPIPGSPNSLSGFETITISAVSATLHITAPIISGTRNITFTFTFSEAVTGFTQSDIIVGNGEIESFTEVSPTTYVVVVSADAPGQVGVTVATGNSVNALNQPSNGGNFTCSYVPAKVKDLPQSADSTTSSNGNKCGLGGILGLAMLAMGSLVLRHRGGRDKSRV